MVRMAKPIAVKDTQYGRDILEVLIEKQLKNVAFLELDVPQSIVTLKQHLVNKFTPTPGEYPSELRFLYPTYFDSARILVAEYVAEFFLTGKIAFAELDMDWWEYIDHEIRQITITEKEVDTLLRVLCKVQNPAHDMYARWPTLTERIRWIKHIQEVESTLSQLK